MSLEDQIKKLTDRVVGVEQRQDQTNDLLSKILAVLETGGLPPAPSNVATLEEVAAEEPAAEAEQPEPEEAEEAGPGEEAAPAATLEGARDALMAYNGEYGRPATIALMEQFIEVGAKPILGNIPEAKFAEVIAACAAGPEKEAA